MTTSQPREKQMKDGEMFEAALAEQQLKGGCS
jgi:hypothetical protein